MEGKIFKRSTILLVVSGCFLFGFFAEAQTPLSALDYAPNLWFDSQEKYYPANPLDFYFENGQEIEGEKAVDKYNQLSLQGKLDKLTVLYHIEDEGTQWVYQYWFFYVFNDYQTGVRNKHYSDWEAVYVFVNKESGQVIKTIGTAHQRQLFDTEIEYPQTNHIWNYVGGGSHANCVDEESDSYCDFLRWSKIEAWDKQGPKINYNDYNLIEMNSSFIDSFNGAVSLEKSPVLGINILEHLKIENKELYIPIGGGAPNYAWHQSSYNNPEEVRPISRKLITEYISDKFSQAKNKIVGFFNDVFGKVELEEQQAGVSNLLNFVDVPEEVKFIPDSAEVVPHSAEVGPLEMSDLISNSEPIPEPVMVDVPDEVRPQDPPAGEAGRSDLEIVTKEIEIIKEEEIIPSPIAPPSFVGSGGAYVPPEPLSAEAPLGAEEEEPLDTTPPPDITDLIAATGNNRGEINLSWTAPGADEYTIKYSTSSVSWASSTDFIGEPTPGLASSTENLIVSNLNINQTYYWAIKSQDEAGNISGISNISSATSSALADHVIINEVQLGDSEFVELYNPTNQDVDMTGWYWSYFSYNKDWNNPDLNKEFPSGATIPAGGYYLIGLSGYPEANGYVNADWQAYNANQLNGTKGSLSIFPWDPTGKTNLEAQGGSVDALGWGSVNYVYETGTVSASGSNKSLNRQTSGWDTDNNNNDFIESNWPVPENSQNEKAAIIDDNFSLTQDITWTSSDGIYILESNLGVYPTIESGAVLTIEPGVIVKGSNKYYPSLAIKGTLKAQGTSDNRIVFTAVTTTPQMGDWSGIVFDNSAGSIIDYATFQYGGYQVSYEGAQMKEMVRMDNSQADITNSIFQYSQTNGVYLKNSNPSISNSSFNNNTLSGVVINGSQPSINDSQLSNNMMGIEINNQASPTISGNTFSSNIYPIDLKNSYPSLSSNQATNNYLNGIIINQDSVFSQNTTWTNDLPYILTASNGHSSLVATGTVLTIEAGTIIKPYSGYYTNLLIEGELVTQGTTSTPIIFTSLKDDDYGGDTNNDGSDTSPTAGDLKDIRFNAGSLGELNHIRFRYGGAQVLDIDALATVNQGSDIIYEP